MAGPLERATPQSSARVSRRRRSRRVGHRARWGNSHGCWPERTSPRRPHRHHRPPSRRSHTWHAGPVLSLTSEDLADAAALLSALERELPGLVTSESSGDWFVFYDPDGITVPEKRLPFLTLVT